MVTVRMLLLLVKTVEKLDRRVQAEYRELTRVLSLARSLAKDKTLTILIINWRLNWKRLWANNGILKIQ